MSNQGVRVDGGLNVSGLVHDGVENVGVQGSQDLVHGVFQLGVALDDGDADVDLAFIDLEVVLTVGEVQDGQVRVGGTGTHGGGHVGADEVHGAGLNSHDHGGSALGLCHDLSALDLRQTVSVPDGALLSSAGAGQLADALGLGLLAVFLGYTHDGGVEVGACHVDLLHTTGGHGLAGDDGVDGAGVQGGDQAGPLDGLDFQLPAVGVADTLGDHHVIAVGIGAGVVHDGHSAVGVVGLGPVVGGVSALHADGQHAVLHAGDGAGVGAGQVLDRGDFHGSGVGSVAVVGGRGVSVAAAAGAQGQREHQSQGQCKNLFHGVSSFHCISWADRNGESAKKTTGLKQVHGDQQNGDGAWTPDFSVVPRIALH